MLLALARRLLAILFLLRLLLLLLRVVGCGPVSRRVLGQVAHG